MKQIFYVLLFIVGILALDPCQYDAQQLLTITDMMECWTLIPYNTEVTTSTIDILRKTIPLYVFLDSARDSPDPRLPVNIDLDEALSGVVNQSFEYDFQLHATLDDIFTQLRDGHTRYLAPKNYGAFTYGFPLGLEIYVENGEMQVNFCFINATDEHNNSNFR
jgi:hypothetical protein